jgi:tRNA threonylcarbamoyladenosine biosynthesis protein TsaE
MSETYLSHSEAETIDTGKKFADRLSPHDIVALYGDLGSGKTRFIKGVCRGLGVVEHVASPTFTILNDYDGNGLKIHHFDFYRLVSVAELREIGFDEYLESDGICVIEWADRVKDLLPPDRYDVSLSFGDSLDCREIVIEKLRGMAR